jgi:hypothetical protein
VDDRDVVFRHDYYFCPKLKKRDAGQQADIYFFARFSSQSFLEGGGMETDGKAQATPAQGRPKIVSVSAPQQPAPTRPRVVSQQQAQPAQPDQQPRAASQAKPPSAPVQDPKSEADWAEQTISQAEKDAEEQRMANDIAQTYAAPAAPSQEQQAEKTQDAPKTPKNEPKSISGLFYAIKGLAGSVSRKITGK